MRVVWTITSGIAFTTLLIVLPMVHVARWNDAAPTLTAIGLASLPLVVLVFAVLRPQPWTVTWLFPVAHLPVLVSNPELTGPLVYSGLEGLFVLFLVIVLGALWIGASLTSHTSPADQGTETPSPKLPRHLPIVATLASAAIWIAFMLPVLDAAQAGRAQASATVVGVAVVVMLLVGGRWLIRDFGELSGDPRHRRRWTVSLLRERQGPSGRLWLSITVAIAGTVMVLALYR